MSITRTRTTLLAAGTALAFLLTGCGSDDTAKPGAGSSATSTIDAAHNDADVAFINDMTPHHEGAVAMAELAPTRAGSEGVKALAARILAAQQPEITAMAAMAKAWDVTLEADGGGHSMGGSGTMGDGDADALEPLSGAAFDKEFLTRMIAHHEGALTMAQTELSDGTNPQAKKLATDIVESQTAEIAEMKTLLGAL